MGYKMRKLKTKDIFKMSKILKKIDVKVGDALKGVNLDDLTKEDKKDDVTLKAGIALAIPIIQTALENIHKAEDEVNEFLGDLVGLSGEEFSELDIEESFDIIMLFKEQKGVSNFLNKAEQLMK